MGGAFSALIHYGHKDAFYALYPEKKASWTEMQARNTPKKIDAFEMQARNTPKKIDAENGPDAEKL